MGRGRSGWMMWDVDERHIKFKRIRGRVDETSVGQFCPWTSRGNDGVILIRYLSKYVLFIIFRARLFKAG